MHYGAGQEWMQFVIVYDFAALHNTGSRTDLRRSPSSRLGYTDGDGIRTVVPGKRKSLRRSDADIPVR